MNLKRNILIGGLFIFSLTLGGCSLFNGDKDEEKNNTSEELNKQSQINPEETDFNTAYKSLVSPLREELKNTVSKITEYDSLNEELVLDVSTNLNSLGLSGDFKVTSNGKSYNGGTIEDTESKNEIKLFVDTIFNNPNTQKQENINATGGAELRVVDGKIFGMLNNLNISSSNPQVQMVSAFANGIKDQWIMFGDIIQQSNVNIDTSMNPYEIYNFADRIAGYIENNPIFETTGESMENGKKIYDIDLSDDNIVSLYKDIMNDKFVNNSIDQMSGTSKEQIIENQSNIIRAMTDSINLTGTMELSKENGVVLNIESLTFPQNKNIDISGNISKKNGIYQGDITIDDTQRNANINFDNKNDRLDFTIDFSVAKNPNGDFSINGYINTDMKGENIYSELSLTIDGSFGNVDILLEDTVNQSESFEVSKPEDYQKLQELMQGIMGGMGGSGQMPSQGGSMQQPQQMPSQGQGGGNIQKELSPEQKEQLKQKLQEQGGSNSEQIEIQAPQEQ